MAAILLSREESKGEWLQEVRGLLQMRSPCPFILLEAGSSAPALATYLAGWVAFAQGIVLYVDAANAFDPYLVSRWARKRRSDPRELLGRIFISRPFTCYQLQTLLEDRVRAAVAEKGARAIVLSGLIDLLLDQAVQEWEARRIMERILEAIGRIREERGVPVLATQGACSGPRRRHSLLLWAEREAQVLGRLEAPPGSEPPRLPGASSRQDKRLSRDCAPLPPLPGASCGASSGQVGGRGTAAAAAAAAGWRSTYKPLRGYR